jgi:hypothetical protein
VGPLHGAAGRATKRNNVDPALAVPTGDAGRHYRNRFGCVRDAVAIPSATVPAAR